ncbi:MAG: MiaB/RimO family radical SAM methylthiotransferase, partial [Planctomycetaceae bacterium]
FQAFVRIMIGCDKFCTYCVVPLTRGPEQSRPPADVLAEARKLAAEGVREITLLGQTVNSYRFQADGQNWRLSDLLVALHEIDGLQRIKFVTNFPRDMSDDLLQAVRDLPRVSKYLHVPAQSGCDAMLKRMKRGYTVGEYREMMARIRETVPGCSVSSDFIVGFCGESEESFQKSMDLLRESRFKNSFIFKYSPRPGTKAHELFADDVPEDVKRRRNNEMLALQNEISEEDNAGLIGRDFPILVEGLSKTARKEGLDDPRVGGALAIPEAVASTPTPVEATSPSPDAKSPEVHSCSDDHPQLVGRTMCDRIVVFDGNPRLIGGFVDVHIYDCTQTTLLGTIVTREYQHAGSDLLPILA